MIWAEFPWASSGFLFDYKKKKPANSYFKEQYVRVFGQNIFKN